MHNLNHSVILGYYSWVTNNHQNLISYTCSLRYVLRNLPQNPKGRWLLEKKETFASRRSYMICKKLSGGGGDYDYWKTLRGIRLTSVRLKLLIPLTFGNKLFLLHPHFCSSFTLIILFPRSRSVSIITIYHFSPHIWSCYW